MSEKLLALHDSSHSSINHSSLCSPSNRHWLEPSLAQTVACLHGRRMSIFFWLGFVEISTELFGTFCWTFIFAIIWKRIRIRTIFFYFAESNSFPIPLLTY